MKCIKFGVIALATALLVSSQQAQACTGITLSGEDGSVVRSRTLEWGAFDMKNRLDIVPRGYTFSSEAMPDGKPGKSWKAKYGFVGISVLGKNAYIDGINEKGLSTGNFYLPAYSDYPEYDPAKASDSMAPTDLLSIILSETSTIEEVKALLKDVHVVPVIEKALGKPAPLHFVVTEPSGKSIVIEYINKELVIFDAPLGVITNSPTYDWHLTNLRNYLNLSAVSLPTKKIEELDLAPLGGGSGMIGLPGDFTPPSRFVRAAALAQTARETTGGYDTVRESFRILDSFNVSLSGAEGSDGAVENDDIMYSATQITTAADTKNKMFYYHTQYNRRIRAIDLNKIDFSGLGTEIIKRPADVDHKEDILELTPGA